MKPQVVIELMILIIVTLLFYYIIDWRGWYIEKFDNLDRQYEHITIGIDEINETIKQWELSE